MNAKPRLFIGSATESLEIAYALKAELAAVARTEVWDRAFRPGRYTLDELTRMATEVDFAAFIVGQEDKTHSRGEITLSPRDNVVYEAGLFAGRLGVTRVFLLVDAAGTKSPTDWKGLGYLAYDLKAGRPSDSVDQAAVRIRQEIADWKEAQAASFEQQISGSWWQFVLNRKEGSVVSLLTIRSSSVYSDWQVSGTAWTAEGKSIARYWSRGAALDLRGRTLFYYWEGEHPFDPSVPAFFGVGEIQFEDSSPGGVSKATGWFSSSPLIQVDQTVRKTSRYARASEADVMVTQGSDPSALKRLIDTRLAEWKAICV